MRSAGTLLPARAPPAACLRACDLVLSLSSQTAAAFERFPISESTCTRAGVGTCSSAALRMYEGRCSARCFVQSQGHNRELGLRAQHIFARQHVRRRRDRARPCVRSASRGLLQPHTLRRRSAARPPLGAHIYLDDEQSRQRRRRARHRSASACDYRPAKGLLWHCGTVARSILRQTNRAVHLTATYAEALSLAGSCSQWHSFGSTTVLVASL